MTRTARSTRTRRASAQEEHTGVETPKELLDYTRESLSSYGFYVVEQRAVPDYRDGLKPVQRSILWAMYKLGLSPRGRYTKCARVVGDTIGKYHPHGDCLRGDTLIPLLDGRTVSIKELAEENPDYVWVLSYDKHNKRLVPAKAHSWRVGQRTDKLLRLIFSNGEYLECTYNHPFYVKGKGWVKAESLLEGTELVGGTIDFGEYQRVSLNVGSRSPKYIHRLVGEFCWGNPSEGEVYHHKDEDKHNNTPRNLTRVSRGYHAKQHGDYAVGLNKGLKTMFSGSRDVRKAIRKKNSTLMRIHNENLWLLKAVKAIRTLEAAKKKLTPKEYERLRGSIYNLTKLTTLEKRGISFEGLISLSRTFKLDTSASRGLTPRQKKTKEKVIRRYTAIDSRFSKCVARTLRSLLKKSSVMDLGWGAYCGAASLASGINSGRVRYANREEVQSEFNVRSVQELAEKMPFSRVCIVDQIERITLKSKENFYDFTVDSTHNALIQSPVSDSGNFVVAHNSAAYQALVNLTGVKDELDPNKWVVTNSPVPLIEGYGSFGDNISSAAAYRYTECRASEFAWNMLLDPAYLAVSDTVENFSGEEQIPLILPAKLPVMLLIGSLSIAFGVSADCPSFDPKGLTALVCEHLSGKAATYRSCLKLLKFKFPYGGECISGDDVLKLFYKTGKASLQFMPTLDVQDEKRTVVVTSYCPGMTSQNVVDRVAGSLRELDGVQRVANSTDKSGFKLEIQANRSIRAADFETFVDRVLKVLTFRYSFDIGISIRKASQLKQGQKSSTVEFHRVSIPKLIAMWCEWRVGLEIKMLKHLLSKHEQELKRLELLVFAVDQLNVIVESLSKEDSEAYLVTKLKISREDAAFILDMRVRQLKKLEKTKLLTSIKEINAKIKAVNVDLKAPAARVVRELKQVKFS